MKIAIAGDHYTVDLIEKLTTLLQGRGFEVRNLGTKSADIKISLQEIIPAVAHEVQSGKADLGIAWSTSYLNTIFMVQNAHMRPKF